jgi:hypothetical protein
VTFFLTPEATGVTQTLGSLSAGIPNNANQAWLPAAITIIKSAGTTPVVAEWDYCDYIERFATPR